MHVDLWSIFGIMWHIVFCFRYPIAPVTQPISQRRISVGASPTLFTRNWWHTSRPMVGWSRSCPARSWLRTIRSRRKWTRYLLLCMRKELVGIWRGTLVYYNEKERKWLEFCKSVLPEKYIAALMWFRNRSVGYHILLLDRTIFRRVLLKCQRGGIWFINHHRVYFKVLQA